MWEKQLCRHQGQWRRRGRRCTRCQSRDSPAAYSQDYGDTGCPPAAHGGPRWSKYLPAAHGGHHTRPGECSPKEAVILWKARTGAGSWQDVWSCRDRGAHTGAGLLAGLVIEWGIHAGVTCSWRTAPCGKGLCWSSSWKTAAHGKDPLWRRLWRTVSSGWDPLLEQGKSVRRKEQQRIRITHWPQPPSPIPLHCSRGRGREVVSDVEPEKKAGVKGKMFVDLFSFLIILLWLNGNKCVMVWLRPATKAPRGRPSPRCGAEENGKKQAETGGSG